VGVTSLLAGVVLGGWLAFETSHWRAFRSAVEGSAAVGVPLAVGLSLLALVVSLLASYRRVTA
jgi:predicted permease